MDNGLKLINYLGKNYLKSYTMHGLSKLLKIPYASFYRIVQKKEDLLHINKVGNSKTIALNLKNPVLKAHLTISSDEIKKDYLKKRPIIRIITKELDTKEIVILFGSYAKGTQTKTSDIDILVINKDGKKSIPFTKYERLYQKEINPIFITKQEFKMMLKDKEENVGKQVLKNHIVLNNPDKFWEGVLNAV